MTITNIYITILIKILKNEAIISVQKLINSGKKSHNTWHCAIMPNNAAFQMAKRNCLHCKMTSLTFAVIKNKNNVR